MLRSTKTYRVTVIRGKHSGYELNISQLCFLFWIFPFWDGIRTLHCETITYAAGLIIELEKLYGGLEIIDNTNSLIA